MTVSGQSSFLDQKSLIHVYSNGPNESCETSVHSCLREPLLGLEAPRLAYRCIEPVINQGRIKDSGRRQGKVGTSVSHLAADCSSLAKLYTRHKLFLCCVFVCTALARRRARRPVFPLCSYHRQVQRARGGGRCPPSTLSFP